MNDIEFETLARTSAATIRAEAERIGGTESALRALLEGAGTSVPDSDAEIIDLDLIAPPRRQPIWVPLMAAAAVVAAFAGVVFLSNGSDDEPAVSTEPATVPASLPVTVPVPGPPTSAVDEPTIAEPTIDTVLPTTTLDDVPVVTPAVTTPEVTAPAGDPFANWVIPEFSAPTLDGVPHLLPTVASDGASNVRDEWTDATSRPATFVQTYARADASGAVTGIIQFSTKFGPDDVIAIQEEVTVPGWDWAYFNDSVPEVVILRLHTTAHSMVVWTSGLDRDTTAQLARSLVVDADGSGWVAPVTAPDDTWTLIAEGWSTETATRILRQSTSDGQLTLEIVSGKGIPDAVGSPGLTVSSEAPMTIADVDGLPALVTDRGVNSAVAWQRDDVVILFGFAGSPGEALERATSLVTVDRETWLAATVEQPGGADGCDGMFC